MYCLMFFSCQHTVWGKLFELKVQTVFVYIGCYETEILSRQSQHKYCDVLMIATKVQIREKWLKVVIVIWFKIK